MTPTIARAQAPIPHASAQKRTEPMFRSVALLSLPGMIETETPKQAALPKQTQAKLVVLYNAACPVCLEVSDLFGRAGHKQNVATAFALGEFPELESRLKQMYPKVDDSEASWQELLDGTLHVIQEGPEKRTLMPNGRYQVSRTIEAIYAGKDALHVLGEHADRSEPEGKRLYWLSKLLSVVPEPLAHKAYADLSKYKKRWGPLVFPNLRNQADCGGACNPFEFSH